MTSSNRFYPRVGKRCVDVVVASIALIASSPIQAVCAVLVRLTSGRPILFTQTRAGMEGEPFLLYKFRTMHVDTHEVSGGYPTPAMVTPVGRFLRKTSLDELPQLWNILCGDMSLVGPRPALLDQVARYTDKQRERLGVRPGITGLAQIRYRNSAPWSKRIESDLEYVDYLSFANDLLILLRTGPAVLFGSGVQTGQTAFEVDDLGPDRP